MNNRNLYDRLRVALEEKERSGLRKFERVISSPQGTEIAVEGVDGSVLNFCANNYLGLANHPSVVDAAKEGIDAYGYGLASVRFICGTQTIHRQLEERLAEFLGMDDAMLFTSCFDANGGLFESVLGAEDALVSARLNHASIIDGVRLCKARRHVYDGDDADDFARALDDAGADGATLAITDGVFSMEGTLAPLDRLAPMAKERGALLAVDDSHATGILGEGGRGTPSHFKVQPDIVTSTLGKALGGACGGFVTGKQELIDWLRSASRPYLFSNSLAPALAAGALAALDIVRSDEGDDLRGRLRQNTDHFRTAMRQAGFAIPEGIHPIVPVMLGDAALTTRMADRLLEIGIYVIGFSYPVVPKNEARIRVQISASHTREQLDQAIDAFATVGHEMNVLDE